MRFNGKTLANVLRVHPKDYKVLYPNIKEPGYCPCMDLTGRTKYCNGMITVMDALKRSKKYELPDSLRTVSAVKKFKSGEVWIDETLRIAYLYIGKQNQDKDVVLNLGGETEKKGEIQVGKVNEKYAEEIFFDKKVFPKY